MTGLQRITGKPIGWVRAGLEVTVLCCGWVVWRTVGLGTVVFAIGVDTPSRCLCHSLCALALRRLFEVLMTTAQKAWPDRFGVDPQDDPAPPTGRAFFPDRQASHLSPVIRLLGSRAAG